MDVNVYSVFVLSCVDSGLETGSSPVQGVLPAEYRITKVKSDRGPKGSRALERDKEREGFLYLCPIYDKSLYGSSSCVQSLCCTSRPHRHITQTSHLVNELRIVDMGEGTCLVIILAFATEGENKYNYI
jgi:hypothetical protein